MHALSLSFSDWAGAGKRGKEEMGMQLKVNCDYLLRPQSNLAGRPFLTRAGPSSFSPSRSSPQFNARHWAERAVGLGLDGPAAGGGVGNRRRRKRSGRSDVVVVASGNAAAPSWDSWKPDKASSAPSLSDIAWPAAGAFAAMAIFGKMDQILAPKGFSMTIAPLGAVCAVLFTAPSSPAARKYNMFMAQIGCAVIGVLAFSMFGPGWLARSTALAASIAFMIYTRATHPPAASLPILFIDAAKLHHLNFWYAIFPGATGCIVLCLIVSSFPSQARMSSEHSSRFF
ncbi:hypothetical protein EUGRSUZ_B00422 [Eucalyptus grandis]|uniref:HPP transmembrane region domain-containing protein n=2 Tax=Eucalyptus grandis TaxID=71139 RepID=A0A059CZD6_EUCGR|nr:hypothetical protein EUGRSUZ_B00422 [Eucalyptus grandis]